MAREAPLFASRVTVAHALLFAVCLSVAANCDRSPAAPSTVQGGTASTHLRIEGPTQVAPGESPRYTAWEVYGDGSRKDVTATAHWSPTLTDSAIHFTGPGVAAPAQRGEALVGAYTGKLARTLVLVLEPGTFKLSGSIVSEAGGGPMSGVTVEVLSGSGQGLRTLTSGKGEYALYGVAGPVRIRASADGFSPQVHDVVVNAFGVTESFTLPPVEAPVAIGGVWTMTVAPSAACRSGLPDSARGRTYHVEVVQTGTHMQAAISSPTLQRTITGFPGTVRGSRVGLLIWGDTGYGEWTWPDVVDRISPTEVFGFSGMLNGTLAGAVIRGTLGGDLVYVNEKERTFAPTWYCRAENHVVTLSR
jgi:hypothetical protein